MAPALQECLHEAGCDDELCRSAAKLMQAGRAHELLPQLARHRLDLLANLREADERLACLDRAIATVRQSSKGQP